MNFAFFAFTFATKNLLPACTYGCSSGAAPSGTWYLFSLSHTSSPSENCAERMTISYSSTSNFASTFTPRSRGMPSPPRPLP